MRAKTMSMKLGGPMDSKEIEKRRLTLDDHMHLTKDGVEFWYAREVIGVFGYTQWRRFEETIKRAMISLESSKTPVRDHFADIGKMVPLGSGAERLVKDYMLTRYACYLIAQNGDPRKEEIAFAQSYFALQTRKQELIEQRMLELRRLTERDALTESEKKPLADVLPDVTMAAKNFANPMTSYNTEVNDLYGARQIGGEHLQNNRSVRGTLVKRGIKPEDLPPEEDAKKLKRRVEADERKLRQGAPGFGAASQGL